VNKNTLLAFLLILVVIVFFSGDMYYTVYETITGKPHPHKVEKEKLLKEQEEQKNISPSEYTDKDVHEKYSSKVSIIPQDNDTTNITENDSIDTMPVMTIDTISVESKKLFCLISEKGANLISIKTKLYKERNTDSLIELISKNKIGGGNVEINDESIDKIFFNCVTIDSSSKEITLNETDPKKVVFQGYHEIYGTITKTYTFYPDDYKIALTVQSNRLPGNNVAIGWKGGIRESETSESKQAQRYDIRKFHHLRGRDITHLTAKKYEKLDTKSESDDGYGYYKWSAITSKYFLIAQINESGAAILHAESFSDDGLEKSKKIDQSDINYSMMMQKDLESNDSLSFWFYVGPTSLEELEKYDVKLNKVMFGGWSWFLKADIWFPFICEIVLKMMKFLFSIFKDYGIVIIILTIILKIVTFPMTQASMKSMGRMKDLQPKIEAVRKRYKSNPQKMNQEIMAVYRNEGVNPLNPGCLPMFLQMPILFSLFVVLRKAIELRGAGTFLLPWISDLSRQEAIFNFPFTIPLYGSNFAILPFIMAAITFFQNKATIKDPNQKAMIYFMPIFMLVLFNQFPSGLVFYWTLSSALGLVQQYFVNKTSKAPVKK